MAAWGRYLWYQFVFWTSTFVMTLGFSLRIRGRQRIPRRGPVLIVANHQSFFDPILIGLASPQPTSALARRTLFRGLLGVIIRWLGAVPIDHHALGKEGLQAVLDELKKAKAVVVYPEGTRSPDGALHAFRPGIYLLIKRARVPVVVLGIAGAHAAWPRTRPLPLPSPVFLAATERTIAVQVGPLLPASVFESRSREEVLDLLFRELQQRTAEAESLRRR